MNVYFCLRMHIYLLNVTFSRQVVVAFLNNLCICSFSNQGAIPTEKIFLPSLGEDI